MMLAVTACGPSYPKIGGVGPMQNYRYSYSTTYYPKSSRGVDVLARSGSLINGAGDRQIGPLFIIDLRNTNSTPRCASVTFSDPDNNQSIQTNSSIYGSGDTWLIPGGKTLYNVGQVNTLQAYSNKSGKVGLQIDGLSVWEPKANGRC
ncbi:hypothetical protein GW813_14810 [bacterium]|nr:hypothetical protein [Erythrobacter sp.]NCQ36312.1 hypothetical protein [bacterium]